MLLQLQLLLYLYDYGYGINIDTETETEIEMDEKLEENQHRYWFNYYATPIRWSGVYRENIWIFNIAFNASRAIHRNE